MTKASVIKATESYVKEALGKEGTGHDWWHIVRVRNNAKAICKVEKTDKFIVDLAILLHDVGDRKVINKDEDDYSIAENFLKKNKVSVETIESVMFIIKNMSFSKTVGNKIDGMSKEFQVVQDADRLDAIGALGIARAFSFGGSRRRLMYDPTQKVKKIKTTEDYKKSGNSTLHHFYEKLLLLKDIMNTKTAKKIALKRHKYMENYIKQFLHEWEGLK